MTTTRLEVSGQPAAAPQQRRSRRTGAWVAAGAGVLVLVAIWIVGFSSVLGVKAISVRGEHLLGAGQITEAAAIGRGTPLVRLDTAAIARRVQALPDVASAQVRVAYPNTVVITVVERTALGYVQSGPHFVLVDKTGDQFRTVPTRPGGLPLFVLPSGPNAAATGAALASVAASLPAGLLGKIASIQAFDPSSITLLLSDQRVVRWGSSDQNALKARILPVLLTQPGTQFDLTDPQQVVTH